MQDKSFLQAMQDLQDRVSNNILDTINYMLVHRTTVTNARAVVKNTLITGQMIALLALMKEMGILDETQYNEFTAYLMHSLTNHPHNS